MPRCSTVPTQYDQEIFTQDEITISASHLVSFSGFERFDKRKFDGLSPALRTACPTAVTRDLKQVLKAFNDRNACVPELQGVMDEEQLADKMVESFIDSYIGNHELLDIFTQNPVEVNVDSIEDWLDTQPRLVRDQAFENEFWSIFEKELNQYSLILKKLPKPKLTQNAIDKFPSPQTVAHHDKDVNAVFCPLVRELKKRLISVLHDHVIMYTDMSPDDLEALLKFSN
uniref:RNA-dependent RNA polymerase n=1 Tax=Ganwon-do negev-like virus 1 TaxID=2789888 RepID=A0A7T1GW35_9VIRU|nr:RNA-dependent RNA polymerase [Ganwon-do negev-like virus 1]